MKNWPADHFEKLVGESLKITDSPGMTSDDEFLEKLNQKLNNTQPKTRSLLTWLNGISNGLVAAAIGLVLLYGLNVLPPFLVNASLTGSGFIQQSIIQASVNQHVLWQQLTMDLEKFK